MSEWNRVEHAVEQPNRATDAPAAPEQADTLPASFVEQDGFDEAETTVRSSLRYTAGGRRRGRYRFAAPLGLLVILLAVLGAVAVVVTGIRAIQKAQDDAPLRAELYDFLLPVAQYNPSAFTNVNDSEQDALLLAAIWRVTEAERIRLKKDSSAVSAYPLDDLGRMLMPIKEIEDSYMVLFGSGVTIYHHTIGDEGKSFTVEFDEAQGVYHIPSISSSSMYVTVIDTLKKKDDTIKVRVGYVLSTKIGIDDKGNEIDPTPDMAEYFQVYTVQRVGESGWKLVSIADEKTSGTSTTETSEANETDITEPETTANATTTVAATTK